MLLRTTNNVFNLGGNMDQISINEPNIFVIFGATGDLTYRKLVPAIYNLYIQNLLPEKFNFVCIGRRDFSQEDYRNNVKKSLGEFSKGHLQKKILKIFWYF